MGGSAGAAEGGSAGAATSGGASAAGSAGAGAGAGGTPVSSEYPGIPDVLPVNAPAKPLYVPIWAPLYELSGNTIVPGSPNVQTTLYEPYNDTTPGWWFNILEEFRYAGIQNSLVLTRAAVTESLQWKALKTNLFSAMKTASVYGQLKFGEFEDAGAWPGCYAKITGKAATVDWSDTATIDQIFWDLMLKRFFDAVPKELWLRYNGRPVWVGWGSVSNLNMQGNIAPALRAAKAKFKAQYGEDLFMVIDQSWKKADTTITGSGDADAVQNWFCCGNAGTFSNWNGYSIGVGVPGFTPINADGSKNTTHAADFERDHGARLADILNQSKTNGANWFIEEGFVDIRESAGIYRSPSWDYPSQYLEIVREYLDSATLTRRLEAEAADSFSDSTPTNQGGQYSTRALDVGSLPSHGWYVGWVTAGEWLKWSQVFFANGSYDVYVRYSSSASNQLELAVGGTTQTVTIPSSNGQYVGTKLLSGVALNGKVDVQLTFVSAGVDLDFVELVKR